MDEKQIQQVIEQISQAVQESPETVMAAIQNGGEKGFEQVVTSLQKGDVKSAKAMIQQLAGARKAAHGAKLDYFRKLKNQCPEGEELYYYKKGGSVGCGCKKKEDGGEVEMAKKGTAVEKFKKGQFGLRTNELVKNQQDKKREEEKKKKKKKKKRRKANTWGASTKYIAKPKNEDPNKMPQDSAVPDEDIPSYDKKTNRKKCGGKVEKDCSGAVAKFKAKCGSKLKKHQQGGSLNGIPFMQEGTPENGIVYKIHKPRVEKNQYGEINEKTEIESVPDQFGRKVIVRRQVYPKYNGTLNNDTIYLGGVVDENNHEPSNINSPKEALKRPFDNWKDYFNHILSLRKNKKKIYIPF